MSKNSVWYGFLEAGRKSSPVVLDSRLQTRNPKTVYLFNYVQGKFLEYSREIVEPKLKELSPDDNLLKELKSAYKSGRKNFVAERGAHKRAIAMAISNMHPGKRSGMDDIPDIFPEDTSDSPEEDDHPD